jgi:hypothetical protein
MTGLPRHPARSAPTEIVQVRAYLDSDLVTYPVLRSEHGHRGP